MKLGHAMCIKSGRNEARRIGVRKETQAQAFQRGHKLQEMTRIVFFQQEICYSPVAVAQRL